MAINYESILIESQNNLSGLTGVNANIYPSPDFEKSKVLVVQEIAKKTVMKYQEFVATYAWGKSKVL